MTENEALARRIEGLDLEGTCYNAAGAEGINGGPNVLG